MVFSSPDHQSALLRCIALSQLVATAAQKCAERLWSASITPSILDPDLPLARSYFPAAVLPLQQPPLMLGNPLNVFQNVIGRCKPATDAHPCSARNPALITW